MTKTYKDPEFKVVAMTNEDVLTASKFDDTTPIGWGTESGETGGTVPVIPL